MQGFKYLGHQKDVHKFPLGGPHLATLGEGVKVHIPLAAARIRVHLVGGNLSGCTSKGLGAMVEGGKDGWLILYLVHRNGLERFEGGLLHGLWGLFPALCTRILDRGMCKKPWASLLPTSTNLLREMERGSGIPSHLPNPRFGKMVHISSPGKKIYSAEIIIVHGHGGAHVP